MNQKGVLLTLMTFLVVVTVIIIANNNSEISSTHKELAVDSLVLDKLNSEFEQVFSDVVSLQKTGREKRFQLRFLPFGYNRDENYVVEIVQPIPLSAARLSNYYAYVNLYAIFLRDANASGHGTLIDFNIEKSGLHRAFLPVGNPQYRAFPEIPFVVKPQCVLYRANDGGNPPSNNSQKDFRLIGGTTANGCALNFAWSRVKKIIVTVTPKDYNGVALQKNCSPSGQNSFAQQGGGGQGGLSDARIRKEQAWFAEQPDENPSPEPPVACRTNAFNAGSSNPYGAVYFQYGSAAPVLIASNHFVTTNNNNRVHLTYPFKADFYFKCTSGSCGQDGLVVVSSTDQNPQFVVKTWIEFKQPVDEFALGYVDLNVTQEGFDIKRYR